MLSIPLNPYTDRMPDGRPKTFTVEADEGAISVSIVVDPREFFRGHRPPVGDIVGLLAKWPDDVATTTGTVEAEALALADEVRRLREQIASATDSIEIHPTADEARAMAAALVHYAGETEERRA